MGTNYYAVPDPCPCCGRGERLHICKSFTSWQAITRWTADGDRETVIASWADWRTYLTRTPGMRIVDEYGDEHTVAWFIERAESVPVEVRRRQYDLVRASAFGLSDDEWLDPDGFSFTARDFT